MTNSKIKINLDALKSRREWKRHKVNDGHNIFRILPPFGENSNGYPYRKWQIIWGLTDPESGRVRPFASSMTSEKRCPVVEYVQQLKKKAETIKAQMQASGASEEDIKARLSSLNKLISDLSPKTIYVYNAADQSGEVGLLELKSTAHKKMKAEMASYINDYNQDPTSLNSDEDDSGVWFDIIRTGQGRETEYDVKRVSIKTKNPQTGKISFEDDRSPLPASVVENYENLAYDLSSIYQVKTYEELAEILEANMPALIEACPDADLGASVSAAQVKQNKATTKTTAVKPSTKIAINIDDDEDDLDQEDFTVNTVTSSSARKASASASSDDDFLAYAEEILKS
ncbi:MAG: hypothetical protein QXG63_03895 [Nitrososphaerales archaeon]